MGWLDGSNYSGQWVNDMAEGHGRITHADGEYYEGSWSRNKLHGEGTYVKQGSTYTGQWVDSLQHGHGKEEWKDGHTYEGQQVRRGRGLGRRRRLGNRQVSRLGGCSPRAGACLLLLSVVPAHPLDVSSPLQAGLDRPRARKNPGAENHT